MANIAPKLAQRIGGLVGWRAQLMAGAIGAVVGLGQPPLSWGWIAFVALIAAFALFAIAANPRQAFWRGWALGAGYALVSMNWIIEPFLVDFVRDGWMAPFALVFMASGFGLFWGGGFWAARQFSGGRGRGYLALAITWTAAEVLRSYALTGFPWGLVSYIWIETPFLQFTSITGPHGLTLATFLTCAAIVAIWRSRRRLVGLAGLGATLAGLFAIGIWIEHREIPANDLEPRIVRLIQPNAPQKQKWDPAMMPVFYARQIELSSEPADRPVDLIIWPEVAVPFLLNDPTAPFWEISAAANGVPVILGAQRTEGGRAFNSMAVIGAGGAITAQYDKHHLVPFGEYLPFAGYMNELGLRAFTAQYGYGYSAGLPPKLLDIGSLGRVLPMICYETIFPHEVQRMSERPDWMLQVTNDAWFGEYSGPYQHLAQARARSVETGLPMVRVANTGISAVIDARGAIVKSLPLGVSGRIDAQIPASLPVTIYATLGDFPLLLVLALGFGWLAIRRYRLTLL